MAGLESDQRRHLLEALRDLSSDSDTHGDPLRTFLPAYTHTQTLSPDVLVIRGERGAGKTTLFRAITALQARNIPPNEVFSSFPSSPIQWIEGFSDIKKNHPDTGVLEDFAQSADNNTLYNFWFGYFVGCLANELDELSSLPAFTTWPLQRNNPAQWVSQIPTHRAALIQWLDNLDTRLELEKRFIYIAYDNLDRIGITNPDIRRRYSAALLQVWLSLSSRYASIRAKIFLREDLFSNSLPGIADSSKLLVRSAALSWAPEALYRILLRHMLASDPLKAWLIETTRAVKRRELQENPHLGTLPPDVLPQDSDAEDQGDDDGLAHQAPLSQKGFTEQLVSRVMGSGSNKGYVFRWIPNHLKDALGSVAPRSMINLISGAAEWALSHGPKAKGNQLLTPVELEAGLKRASEYRVRELQEEYAVVGRLKRLQGMRLFASLDDVKERLRDLPPNHQDAFGRDGDAVFNELERLGIVRMHSDGRVDMPDIYRYGYDIKRHGGVKRAGE